MATKKTGKDVSLKDTMEDIKDIVAWFEDQQEPDVEAGLEKVKAATELIKAAQVKLDTIENEFEKLSK